MLWGVATAGQCEARSHAIAYVQAAVSRRDGGFDWNAMIHWTEDIDPKSIPDPTLYSEVARRRGAKRKIFSGGHGRPKVLKPCPVCGRMLGTVERRKHKH